jgi:UDP-N-acetylglucosamine--N-acetylmuramyl-(pentapeptide) pyrophosphoryl-undecaprenol N-acetylglucosamine transferase
LSNKKILITAGGTGGHVFPALSVANELKKNNTVIWVGAKRGIENQIVPKNGIQLFSINISGVRNKGISKILLLPITLAYALLQALIIILKHKPNVIIGFGGYAAIPTCIMGKLCNIPVLIHEQNSVPGMTNRLLAKFVNKVMVAFPDVLIKNNSILVGNPVRDEIINMPAPDLRYANRTGKLNLLVVGGSLGAKIFNDTMPLVAAKLDNVNQITHQSGKTEVDAIVSNYKANGWNNVRVVNFIESIADIYATTDLIICRSGALTVSEIQAAGIAAIFIPYPYAVDDHQTTNVKHLVAAGGALMLEQKNLTPEILASSINSFDREKCKRMAIIANSLAQKSSTQQIVELVNQAVSN